MAPIEFIYWDLPILILVFSFRIFEKHIYWPTIPTKSPKKGEVSLSAYISWKKAELLKSTSSVLHFSN